MNIHSLSLSFCEAPRGWCAVDAPEKMIDEDLAYRNNLMGKTEEKKG